MRAVLALVVASLFASDEAVASEPAPYEIVLSGVGRVRLQIAEGMALPCDSTHDRMLFDGWAEGGTVAHGTTAEECLCVRSTSARFPNAGWSPSGLACRPRARCGRRFCPPPSDPTIRVSVDVSPP